MSEQPKPCPQCQGSISIKCWNNDDLPNKRFSVECVSYFPCGYFYTFTVKEADWKEACRKAIEVWNKKA